MRNSSEYSSAIEARWTVAGFSEPVGLLKVPQTGGNPDWKQRSPAVTPISLENSFDPRKTRKARKYSKRYEIIVRHPKGDWLRNTTY
jgi:hypothetical protein